MHTDTRTHCDLQGDGKRVITVNGYTVAADTIQS